MDISEWRKFKNIVVVGPNRTGTTFFSRYISEELNFRLFDEENHRYCDPVFFLLLRYGKNKVFQAPGYMCATDSLADDDTLFVIMKRDIHDIVASSVRIRGEMSEARMQSGFSKVLVRYRRFISDHDQLDHFVPSTLKIGSSAVFRYAIWENYQKERAKNFIEINYEDLSCLDKFLPQDARQGFQAKQTHVRRVGSLQVFYVRLRNAIIFRLLRISASIISGIRSVGPLS